ncbi:CDP-glycerol glycerophosphotransferase family protein [Candidatus Fermentibacteria bacterium]|nr:CDP-glycerol glycerophosphotransferase family protein [Candidatus Fermentibacteria bacterium]
MILSGRLISLPYAAVWKVMACRSLNPAIVFYCGDALDYAVFEPVLPHLPPIPIVAKNRAVQRALAREGVSSGVWPVFPRAVIMARHALHRFPLRAITKIGLRHGAYHFKQFIRPDRYNAFDLFVFTSTQEVRLAREHGIHSGVAGGFPKLDPMFAPGARHAADAIRRERGFKPERPSVLFTATWDRSGLSAIERWYRRVHELVKEYNVMVTVHPQTSRRYVHALQNEGVHLIREARIWPYLLLADVMVGDTSSILAEFCALDKPMITYRVGQQGRLTAEIQDMLERISLRIDSFDELSPAIARSLAQPDAQSAERRRASALMFDELDGAHGIRTAHHIMKILRERGILGADAGEISAPVP